MVDPRHAQSLVVSALALGLSLGPAGVTRAAVWAPAKERAEETDEPAEETDEPAEETDEPAEAAEPASDEPPEAGADEDEGAAEATTPPPQADPSATERGEPADVDAVTVHPRSASTRSPTSKPIAALPTETVVDPRRRDADGRLLVRAGLLSLGVAGLAVVPTVFGLQRGAYARGVLDELDTPSEAGVRADVEAYEQRMNNLALVGGIVAGAQLVTGAILLGVGLRNRNARPERRHALAPAVGSGRLGVVWRARF